MIFVLCSVRVISNVSARLDSFCSSSPPKDVPPGPVSQPRQNLWLLLHSNPIVDLGSYWVRCSSLTIHVQNNSYIENDFEKNVTLDTNVKHRKLCQSVATSVYTEFALWRVQSCPILHIQNKLYSGLRMR